MAVKIVRQTNKIALLGAPVSAAALAPGGEGAPASLRNAGLASKLQSIGYEVADMGDDPVRAYQIDEESPRARNLRNVLAALDALRPRVEIAVKSGALPVILSGDCSVALAVVAGLRRYFRNVSLLYADADADLQTPATTPSGCVDGMVVSHLVGRGASEMVRFWSEPPLVREPDLALFGVSRLDPAEEQALQTSPLRRYLVEDVRRKSPAKTASEAIERIHGATHEFVLHFDVDVIADFQATNLPSSEGLNLEELREAFSIFAALPHLAAIEVTGYNPSRDSDGSCAKLIVDFLGEILSVRREKMKTAAAEAPASPAPSKRAAANAAAIPADDEAAAANADANLSHESAAPPLAAGEAWSSDMLDQEEQREPAESLEQSSSETAGETEDSHS
ncbi:MAG TPA: arginase family protein [Candidatus Acidoferrales bacterium]|nr:arginase family protein [Candidatus Acidoferrales bacterium]